MVKTNKGKFAHAGIGGGWVSGMVAYTTAVNTTVKTDKGQTAHAGIGGGGGWLKLEDRLPTPRR
ncbi:hypothetical protein [Endozoicomonas sp. GU-1]|uniref:hypothetical protein n=1 Tax=Endozoicomonas sp. GU-1 TaxID=3009078 RepID=UPI0022B5D1FB|nr:hypothetical protein [Endozoicomonas sp. GU-1]WBA88718.1 hypothetical protein O3276_12305 [Endozoicomonas sp. GU-1]